MLQISLAGDLVTGTAERRDEEEEKEEREGNKGTMV